MIATVIVVVEESPESLDSVAIDAEALVGERSEKHAAGGRRPRLCLGGRGGSVRLVAGETGNGPGARGLTITIEGRHVPRLRGDSSVEKSYVGVIDVFRHACGGALALAVAAGAQLRGEVGIEVCVLRPKATFSGSAVRQMAGTAWAGFGGVLAAHVARLGR